MKKSENIGKYLLIASTEAYSGKSATILGIAEQLRQKGVSISYAKPIGTESSQDAEADVRFIAEKLELPPTSVYSPLLFLSPESVNKVLTKTDQTDYPQQIQTYLQNNQTDLVIIEGPANLWEGSVFGLSVPQIADLINAPVLLVAPYHPLYLVDILIKAKKDLSEDLLGVIINDVPLDEIDKATDILKPFLTEQGIDVLGLIPRNRLLRSISVREITKQLQAEILCRGDRLDLMVESLAIGAMNVNAAMEYFRQWKNMAVITGSDRTDVQLAALESSTQCLILTGNIPPQPFVLSRAEDLEIPILLINLDTLTTVEIIDNMFGKVRVQEPIKVKCIQDLIQQHFALQRLIEKLDLSSNCVK
ncbi:phosphotransacetylase family protein [Gloeocapsa sp. PCC 73106]|uniref:phosphotransacetylase family protein n=1 Tax=Gloeocapsa sp. PCC 73106 TaxID=102232 RepID=UPI0002ABAC63|nr:phosphotransacetylase family protein [Gloeocapsa sp. PCC 73106]ELR98289.1 protein with phosphotransacetylase BioD-like N-terminal domain [Gloeocapsa sp. PCC 73106]